MSLVGMPGMGFGASSGLRFSSTRGRIQGGTGQGIAYPNPFFDVAHTYLPVTVKHLFRWVRYFFMTQPLVNATVFKLSEYPITDIVIDHENSEVVHQWMDYMQDHLRYRSFQVEVGLDYHVYGNAFVSIGYPFVKYLTCTNCNFSSPTRKVRSNWVFTNNEFRLTCPKCGHTGSASVRDYYFRNPSGIKLIRWNPEDIEITYNDITGDYTYFYTIPANVRSDITLGRKDILETTPQVFIEAIKQAKGIVFSKDNFFHLRRPSLATIDRGWGLPLLLPVLKDIFYLQIMKKAQECVAPSTFIETDRGIVRASEVRIGTLVRTHTGGYRPVTERQVRPMVEERGDYGVQLTITGLRQLVSTFSNNHPMWVLRRNDFQWIDAGEVSEGDYIGYPTSRLREEQTVDLGHYTGMVHTNAYVYSGVADGTAQAFEQLEFGERVVHDNAGRVAKRHRSDGTEPKRFRRFIELDEDLAYVAGWYLGDGSCGSRHVEFSMGPDDTGHELQGALQRLFDVECSSYPSKLSRGWQLCACDTILAAFLSGWLPGESKTKLIPKEILSAPDNVVLAFLRGYLEADGCTTLSVLNDESIDVCCSNQQLTYQLWSLALSFGCISTVSERTSYDTDITKLDGSVQHLNGGRPVFYWSVSSRSARRLAQLLRGEEAEVVTSGKSGFFMHDYFAARVLKAEIVPCPEVISFEVEEDHTFCVPGMATHNSILLEHIIPLRIIFPQAGSGTSDPYCLSASSIVEANLDYKRAEDVRVGDLVKTASGSLLPVSAVAKRPVRDGEEVFRFTICGMSAAPVEASEEHPFLAVPMGGKQKRKEVDWLPRWVEAKDLHVGDYVAYPLHRKVEEGMCVDMAAHLPSYVATDSWIYRQITDDGAQAYEFVECREQRAFVSGELQQTAQAEGWTVGLLQSAASRYRRGHCTQRVSRFLPWSEDLATVVGYYLAEGCVDGDKIVFALNSSESWICDELDEAFGRLTGRKGRRDPAPPNGLRYVMNDSIFGEFLKNYCGHLAWNKKLPSEAVHLPENILMRLVRCVVNGDGGAEQCFRDNGTGYPCRTSSVTFTTTSFSLALKLRELLLYLGVVGRVHTTRMRKRMKCDVHRVKINGQMAVDFWKRLGWSVPEEPVKKDTTRSFVKGGYAYFRVQKKEAVKDVDYVYGFQVDGDKSFCVPSCATHNTTINLTEWREHVASEIARWRYDCVTSETLVETADGLVRAGDVVEGDQLKNYQGTFSRIDKIWRRSLRDGERAYRINARGLSAVQSVFSEGHPIWAARKFNNGNGHKLGKPEMIRVKDLNVGDYVGEPVVRHAHAIKELDLAAYVDRASTVKWVYTDYEDLGVPQAFEYLSEHGASESRQDVLGRYGCSINQYKTAQQAIRTGRSLRRVSRYIPFDEELAWVVGVYLAEGSTLSKQVLFALHEKEQVIYSRLDRFFVERFNATSFISRKTEHGIQVVYSSKIAAEFFSNLCSGIAITKKIPDVYMGAEDRIVAALLCGMYDGDGCAHDDGTSDKITYGSSSRNLANSFRWLCFSLGVPVGISSTQAHPYEIVGKVGMAHASYRVGVHAEAKDRLLALFRKVPADVVTSCRMGVFRDGYFWHRIRSIEQVEAEEVIGFQMDREVQVCIDDDAEAHGTFCTWGMAGANSNYIPIMPLPIGNQTIGGDGKGLLMAGEIQQWSEWIITGMGVPREFLQGGLCLSQNSMVFTDRGLERLSEIRESGSAQRRVVTHEGIGEASQLHQPGRKKVFRVRTRSGLMLDGASTHKLLTLRRDLTEDFTQIGSMTGGEYVAVKVGANLWPTDPFAVTVALTKVGGRYANRTLEEVTIPREVTPELARILGYLTSEGYCASPRRMSFSNTDKVLFDDFVTCMQYVFNITLGMYLEEYDTVNSPSGKKTKYKTEISRQTVVEFLQGLGLSTDSYGKNVPKCIRLSPKNIVVNFLRAYFDGDGGVSTSNGKLCVAAHSVSEELLQEVQLLLLNIGVVSSLYSPYPTKSTYTLQIRSEFGRKYLDEVGFTSPAKAAVGELEIETRTAGNCSNTVPFLRDALLVARDRHVHGFGSWRHEPVDAVLSKEEYTVDEVAHLLRRERSSISGYIRKGSLLAELKNGEQGRFDYYVIKAEDLQHFMRTRGVGKRRTFAVRQYEYGYDTLAASDLGALKTLEPELYSRVKLLQDQAFFWDEVVSVEELELEEEMLDLGVEGSHSYQANGIIGHNSWAGTNVSMRMLENAFLGYIIRHKAMAKWVMQSIASFMKWPEVNIRFKPFKMADDLQRKAYRFQLNMAQKLSDTTLLADDDLDQEEENKIMERETATRLSATKAQQLAMAKIQGEQQLVMMKYQAKAQEAMTTAQGAPAAQGEPGGPETMDEGAPGGQMAGSPAGQTTDQAQGGAPQGTNSPLNQGQQLPPGTQSTVDIPAMAYQYAQQIAQMPPNQQQMTIQTMQQSQPELVDLVIQMLAQMGIKLQSPQPMQGVPGAAGKAATEINMNPLPDVLPPRRAAGVV